MKRLCAMAMAFVMGAGVIAISSESVEARVVCKKGYRILKGQRLGTPYCQDLYLAKVAREFGVRVAAREILNNPNKKREVCQFIGWDIRIEHICESVLPRRGPL